MTNASTAANTAALTHAQTIAALRAARTLIALGESDQTDLEALKGVDLDGLIATMEQSGPPTVFISMDGGLVHEVISDSALDLRVLKFDFDIEGCSEDELDELGEINGKKAFMSEMGLDVDAEYIALAKAAIDGEDA